MSRPTFLGGGASVNKKFPYPLRLNTSAGSYNFFLNLAIISMQAYVDKYLVTLLALFFSPPTSDDENCPTMVRGGNGP